MATDKGKGKISRLYVRSSDRRKNQLGKYAVPCQVSDRWLQFAEHSGGGFPEGEYLAFDVMTTDTSGEARRLCSVVVTREDLLRTLGVIKPPKYKE